MVVLSDVPDEIADSVRDQYPDIEIRTCDSFESFPDVCRLDPHIAYTERFQPGPFPRAALFEQPSLRMVFSSGAGINHLTPWDPATVSVCNAGGVQDEGLAQFAMARLLAISGRFFEYHDQQKRKEWRYQAPLHSPGGTLVVVGLGRIGRACARVAHALGMTVYGVRARPAPCAGVEKVVAPDDMNEVLGRADYVIVVTPLTDGTKGLIGATAFDAMKPGVILHNMARGHVVVEKDLRAALENGKVAAASLDVFEEEPLPADSPFWTMSNVFITPHTGGMITYEDFVIGGRQLFLENIRRFLSGEELLNITDPTRGY